MKTSRDKKKGACSQERDVNTQPSKSRKCLDNSKYVHVTGVDSERQTGHVWGRRLDTGNRTVIQQELN